MGYGHSAVWGLWLGWGFAWLPLVIAASEASEFSKVSLERGQFRLVPNTADVEIVFEDGETFRIKNLRFISNEVDLSEQHSQNGGSERASQPELVAQFLDDKPTVSSVPQVHLIDLIDRVHVIETPRIKRRRIIVFPVNRPVDDVLKEYLIARIGPDVVDGKRHLVMLGRSVSYEVAVLPLTLTAQEGSDQWVVEEEPLLQRHLISERFSEQGLLSLRSISPDRLVVFRNEIHQSYEIMGYYRNDHLLVGLLRAQVQTFPRLTRFDEKSVFAQIPLPLSVSPDRFLSGEPIECDPTRQSLVIRGVSGSPDVYVPFQPSNDSKSGQPDGGAPPDVGPESSAFVWDSQLSPTLGYLRVRGGSAAPLVSIRGELLRHLTSLDTQPRGSSVVTIGIPDTLLAARPNIGDQTAAEVLEAIKDKQGEDPYRFLYLKFGRHELWDWKRRAPTLIPLQDHYLNGRSRHGPEEPFYVVIDLREFGEESGLTFARKVDWNETLFMLRGLPYDSMSRFRLIILMPGSELNALAGRSYFDNHRFTTEHEQSSIPVTAIDVSSRVSSSVYIEVLMEMLRQRFGITISDENLSRIVEAARNQRVDLLSEDLKGSARQLASVLRHQKVASFLDRHREQIPSIVSAIQRLRGNQASEPIPPELIREFWNLLQKLSANSPSVTSQIRFHNLDPQILGIGRRIAGWAAGAREEPLIIPIMGPKGTGKTSLVKAIAEVMKVRGSVELEVVDISSILNLSLGKARQGSEQSDRIRLGALSPDEVALDAISEAVQNLRMLNAPIRMLLVDEFDKLPLLLKHFLAAASGSQGAVSRALNLNGVIVFLNMNVNEAHDAVHKIEAMSPIAPGYASALGRVFVSIYDGAVKQHPELGRYLEPFYSRLVSAYYFGRIKNQSRTSQEIHIRDLVSAFRDQSRMGRIVIRPDALEYLMKIYHEAIDQNFRGIQIALQSALNMALAIHVSREAGAVVEGRSFFLVKKDERGQPYLDLVPLDQDISGTIQDAEDTYRLTIKAISTVLKSEAHRLLEGEPTDPFRDLSGQLVEMSDALTALSRASLFDPNRKTTTDLAIRYPTENGFSRTAEHNFMYPPGISSKISAALQRHFVQSLDPLVPALERDPRAAESADSDGYQRIVNIVGDALLAVRKVGEPDDSREWREQIPTRIQRIFEEAEAGPASHDLVHSVTSEMRKILEQAESLAARVGSDSPRVLADYAFEMGGEVQARINEIAKGDGRVEKPLVEFSALARRDLAAARAHLETAIQGQFDERLRNFNDSNIRTPGFLAAVGALWLDSFVRVVIANRTATLRKPDRSTTGSPRDLDTSCPALVRQIEGRKSVVDEIFRK